MLIHKTWLQKSFLSTKEHIFFVYLFCFGVFCFVFAVPPLFFFAFIFFVFLWILKFLGAFKETCCFLYFKIHHKAKVNLQ